MGNVPTKLDEGNYGSNENGSYNARSGRSLSISTGTSTNGRPTMNDEYNNVRSRRGTSLVGNILSASGRYRADSVSGQPYKKRSTKEREQMKENHARQLVVKFDESVDGGFLAPYGCYGFEKLDYDAEVVKSLITARKLAPFYTPLQDFDESWTKEELIKIVDGLPLHAAFNENLDEFEDVPVGNLKKQNFDDLIDKSLSKREQRRLRSKIFKARLYRKRIIWQELENESLLEQKIEFRKDSSTAKRDLNLPSDDLKYSLYKNGTECPICFLYYPEPLNYSRCCLQPICTECFVQIKRAEPHFPHDEIDPTKPPANDDEKDPNLLTSEPANCAYCATPNFGVTFQPAVERRTGIGGIQPGLFKSPMDAVTKGNIEETEVFGDNQVENLKSIKVRRGSRSHDDPTVITSDIIRPDWKAKLNKERLRLARRSANATAIHVSNQLVDPEHSSRRGSNADYESNSNMRGISPGMTNPAISELENEMIEQAIRLSLADEENKRKSKTSARS